MKEIVSGIEAMHQRAADFVRDLKPGSEVTVIALTGDLGSGKTTFVQGVARALGIKEQITSPTFVIEKIYPLQNQPFERLTHIDAYRLKNADELRVLGFDGLLRDPKNLIFIEWPERVAEAIPHTARTIRLHFVDETSRRVEVIQ